MNEQKTALRLEISPDGSRAALYEGQLLIYGFKFIETERVFEVIPLRRKDEDLMLYNQSLRGYLDVVLQTLEKYKKDADKLNEQRKSLESLFSGLFNFTD